MSPGPLPMLVEKPPVGSYREALELAARVRASNVVGFNRRYMPLNRRFRELAAGLIDEYRDFPAAIADPGHATVSNFRNACNTMRIAEAIEAAGQA